MAIRKIGIDKYQMDISRGRKLSRHREVFYGDEKAARTYEVQLQEQFRVRKPVNSHTIQFVWTKYREWILAGNHHCASHRALQIRIDVLDRVCMRLGKYRIDFLPPEIQEKYQGDRIREITTMGKHSHKGGARMINLELTYLYGMSSWALDAKNKGHKYATVHIQRIEMLPVEESKPRPVPIDIVNQLLTAMTPIHRAMCLLMCASGLRSFEVFALRKRDIYWDEGYGIVRGKGSREEAFAIIAITMEALKKLPGMDQKGLDELLFPPRASAKKSETRVDIRKTIATARKKAGIEMHITPHMLRHTFASYTLLRSGDIKAVKEAMRHRKIQSTMVYTEAKLVAIKGMVDSAFDGVFK